MSSQGWPFVASIIYTAAWSISFYGQIYENYKYKSVQGYSLNYFIMNISGYVCYGIYSTVGFFTSVEGAGTVLLADLFFSYHALLMIVIMGVQVILYPHGKNKISPLTFLICIGLWIIIILETFFSTFVKIIPMSEFWNPISCLGYGKLVLSLIKYSPAVYWNYKRKSTKGWSNFAILLDIVGGSLSLASGGISTENGLNITKTALGMLTILYDLIFILQHYVLYRQKSEKNLPLLKENDI